MPDTRRILVTGATGYVGGRLVPILLGRGDRVRCMVRDPRMLKNRWSDLPADPWNLEVVQGDVLAPDTLPQALEGVHTAYYLIHAMTAGERGFEQRDRLGAEAFGTVAAQAGVKRIIYLGGLGTRMAGTSPHLHSRHETGDILRQSGVPVMELRAAMIVGSGSASFEMLRNLTEKLPIMVCPRWIDTRTQPIFIRDALAYLAEAVNVPETAGCIIDIGGPDVLSYRQMMKIYAEVKGIHHFAVAVPLLTPRFSAYWCNWFTPVPASVAFPLIEGLKFETVCENGLAEELMPKVPRTPFKEAIRLALLAINEERVPTRWSDAVRGAIPVRLEDVPYPREDQLRDRKIRVTNVPATTLNRAFSRVGGEVGWYYADWLWEIRGAIDRLVGGVGVRRGRRLPEQVEIGDAIDFWRVEDYSERRMLLHAEMKVPGHAWLEFRILELGQGQRALVQTAYYFPGSLWGYLYWFSLMPVHLFVFRGMLRKMVQWAEQQHQRDLAATSSLSERSKLQ